MQSDLYMLYKSNYSGRENECIFPRETRKSRLKPVVVGIFSLKYLNIIRLHLKPFLS